MSAMNRMSVYSGNKAVNSANKYYSNSYNRQKGNTFHLNRHVTLLSEDEIQFSQGKQKQYDRQQNKTQNKYNRRSMATLNSKPILHIYQKHHSFSNQKRANQKNQYLLRPKEDFFEDQKRQNKLLLAREEKVGKLKQLYNLKNRMNHDKRIVPTIVSSNIKINTFKGEKKKSPIQSSKSPRYNTTSLKTEQKSKEKAKQQKSVKYLPKFFDFYEQNEQRQHQNQQSTATHIQQQLPQSLRDKANKVKSMKVLTQTPSMYPVTFANENHSKLFNPQSIRQQYTPHLQTFRNIQIDHFFFRKIESGVYFGQLRTNTQVFQGRGIIFYKNGKTFEGHFVNGRKQGLGYEYYPDKSYYLGNFIEGRREGKGRFQWSNGEQYDGQWKNGKKEGSGIWKGESGLSYVGEWHSDTIDGFGVLAQNNTRYQGQFKHFMKWGNGTMRFENGQTYTGLFKQNLPNGVGDYYWSNGDHYNGQFANGKRHGVGMIKYSSGGTYNGQFQNDKKSGRGQQIYEDGLFYEGQFENNLRHGWGRLSSDKQIIFEGYWLNNAAINPKTNKFETIIEQQNSICQQDQLIKKINKMDSNISLLRNKLILKKQQKVIQRTLCKDKSRNSLEQIKPFRRACNCQRHRKQNQSIK